MKYAKLVAAVVAAGLAAAVAAFTDDLVTNVEKINIAIAVVTAASVFAAPNVPGAMYTKSILAVLGAVLAFLTSAITDGVSTSELVQIGVIALGALSVYAVPNTTDEVRSSGMRPLTGLLLCGVLLLSTSAWKCGDGTKTPEQQKAEFLSYARDIQQAFVSFTPTINALKPNWKDEWARGTGISANVIAAVEASNKTEVGELIAELIPIVTGVVSEFTNNPNALLILAAADIGLHFFLNHYTAEEVAKVSGKKASRSRAATSAPLSIEEYKARPVWGCQYLPEKCKGLKKAA